jgi:Domain of unknown function (DUF4190)
MTSPEQPGNWSDPTVPTPPSGSGTPETPSVPSSPPSVPSSPPSVPSPPPAVPLPPPPAALPPASVGPTAQFPSYEAPPPYPPQSGQPYGGYAYGPVVPPTNGLAIASMIMAILGFGPIAAIMGHIARTQIRERGEQGDGFALAGIIVGWVTTGIWLLVCCGIFGVFGATGIFGVTSNQG